MERPLNSRDEILCRNTDVLWKRTKKTKVKKSSIQGAGWGLFAEEPIFDKEFIIEYTGEIITEKEHNRRAHIYDKCQQSYTAELSNDLSLDATWFGNVARFVNHGAKELINVSPIIKFVNGTNCVCFFASRLIGKGEELFFNYGYHFDVNYIWYKATEEHFAELRRVRKSD